MKILVILLTSFSLSAAFAQSTLWDAIFMITDENYYELRDHFVPIKDKSKDEMIEIAKKKYPAILEFVTKLDPEMGKRLESEKLIEKMIATPESKIKELMNNYHKSYSTVGGPGRTGGGFGLQYEYVLLYPDHYLRKFFRCQKFKTYECRSFDASIPVSNYWPILD